MWDFIYLFFKSQKLIYNVCKQNSIQVVYVTTFQMPQNKIKNSITNQNKYDWIVNISNGLWL